MRVVQGNSRDLLKWIIYTFIRERTLKKLFFTGS